MTYKVGQAYLAFKIYEINAVHKGSVVTAPDGSRFQVILTDSRDNGYQGALLKNLDTDKYEFVNRGTEPRQGGDINADLQMGMGALPDQVQSARAFLLKAKEEVTQAGGNPNADISISGHSLGGAITQILGSENPELPAIAFNPYGVGNLIPTGDYPNIANHVMARDPVSVMPGSSMPGSSVMYLEPDNTTGDTSSSFASHGSGIFLIASVIAQSGKPVRIDVPNLEGITGDPATGMPWAGTGTADSPTVGGSVGNVSDRIKPIGTVAIDESLKAPPSAAEATQNIVNHLSPDGKEPLGQQISDGPGKSHSWQLQDDGSVIRVYQENFGTEGSKVTVTTFTKGEVTPGRERQTVSGPDGIVSDALLKPDGTGAMVVDKIQLGGVLEASTTTTGHTFTPLPSAGTVDNSYTVKPGDSLWKIGKSLGLNDGETMQFIADTEANTRAAGSNANVNDLKPGNTLALPGWVQDRQHRQADTPNGATAGSDAHFSRYSAPSDVTENQPDAINTIPKTPAAPAPGAQPPVASPTGGLDSVEAVTSSFTTNPRPDWLAALHNSSDASTKEVARMLETSDFARTFDQIQRSPILQQDIIEFVTGTGRFDGRGAGRLSTEDINAGAGAYSAGDNSVRIAPDRLQGVDREGKPSAWPDGAAVIGHEIQHASNRADVNGLPTQSDPNFFNATSPQIVWNNLLDEAEGQLRQYRIAKEIYDHEEWSYEVDPFQVRPQLSMGNPVLPGRNQDDRSQRIEQWLDDGVELYRHGLIPSPDYLARANLAVEIGNNQQVSVEGGSTNYIDYYANSGMPTQSDPQRMQHVEITGIENGKISVTFSGVGNEARLVRLTQPVDAGAEGPWNAEIGRRIPATSGSVTQAPTSPASAQEIEIIKTVSSDGKGNTAVADHSSKAGSPDGSDTDLTHYPPTTDAGTDITIPVATTFSPTGSTKNTTPSLVDTDNAARGSIASGPDGSDAHFNHHPPTLDLAGLTKDLGFASTLIIGLKNWGSQDDLGHLSTLVSVYNQGTAIAGVGGSAGPLGDLGSFGAGLGVVAALNSHNPIAVASSGASFYNSVAASAGFSQIPIPVINALNIVGAVQSGNPMAIASSVAACFPPYGTLVSIGISLIGSLFGSNSPPPPPDGVVHYSWDESGTITIQTDQNVSGGGDTAKSAASNILSVLQSAVDQKNDQNHAQGLGSSDNLALDPSRLPKVGFTAGMSWIEVTHPDGTTTKETIDPGQLGERLLQVAVANDAVVPQWQVQTMLAHHQAHQQEARQAAQEHAQEVANASTVEIDGHGPTPNAAPNTNTAQDIDGHAPATSSSEGATTGHGPDTSAQGVAGKATESADHKSQTYDALVVHLGNPTVQAHISAIAAAHEANANSNNDANSAAQGAPTEVLRDIDGDGYFENTQWVSATDTAGNAQGMLVLDANRNGTVDTADILHLGGNSLERNSMAWLDANGDGKLDASDPAFAAIKLWVDVNHNGRMDAGESTGLQGIQLTSIDLTHGTLNYADGQSDQLTTTTLSADTEGVKLDTVKVVGADGKLKELDAGALVVHKHYDGKTRTVSYELQAKRIGDWEGTAEQSQHRHGGGNVAGAPTQTNATGATSTGAVVGKTNVTTATTMELGDKRITSDAQSPSASTAKPTNNTISINVGDARIASNTPIPKPVVFVPPGAGILGEDDADEEGWIHLPNDALFGKRGINGALTAVALGAVQATAYPLPQSGSDTGFVWQTTALGADASTPNSANRLPVGEGAASSNQPGSIIALENFAVVRQLHLGVLPTRAPTPASMPATVWTDAGQFATPSPGIPIPPSGLHHPARNAAIASLPNGFISTVPASLYIAPGNRGIVPPVVAPTSPTAPTSGEAPQPPASTTPNNTTSTAPTSPPPTTPAPPTTSTPPINTTPTPTTPNSATTADDRLSDPQEDTVLRVGVTTLLANDTFAVDISAVGNAQHGTVTLSGSDVIFTPEANYHGPASFAYVVTGQDGGRAAGIASFTITGVNDVPITLGETVNTNEDSALTITQATLLANDTDVDVATDGQALQVSAVGHAQHGTVSVLGNGSIRFTPDANFHGTGSFEYVVSDGHGGTATGTATVQVAAVNDVPVVLGETITATEDATLLISQAALLANDSDADVATDAQLLGISAVSNATHGTVSILGSGQIQFVPDANYAGPASFDYVVSDGHGGTATATATVLVGTVDDAPVASGETVNSQEDQMVTLTAAALLVNETDVDNPVSSLQISRVAAGTGGTVTLNGSGNVVFTPTANFNGTASFTYWVKDPAGLESNPATVTLNVAAVNDSPYAQGEVVSGGSEDADFHIDKGILLANDGDAEDSSGSLSIELVGGATHGTVSLDGSGNVVFTPAANFNGVASFQYAVRDSGGAASPTVTADIQVAPVNDNPVGVDDQFAMYTNSPTAPSTATIGFNQLIGNDTDVDNPSSDLTVSGVRNATNGTATMTNGQVTFTPTLNFNGTASFEYQVDDQHGGQTWATAFVTVAPPPNKYASINVTYANFYPTGSTPAGAFDMGDVRWNIVDDGNPSSATVTLISATYHVFGDPGPAITNPQTNTNLRTNTSWYLDIQRVNSLDALDSTWLVTDDRGLQNTWHFSYIAGSGVTSHMDFSGYAPPVVLALDGNAPHYIETSQSNVRFDLNGDGVADPVAWAAPGSGVLGIDLNGDHRITNASEFAFTQYTPGAKTDLEGLRAFDTNHNGVLDAADAQWGQFGVWEDKNSDGQTQEGEYQSLDQLGLASINLSSDKDTHAPVQVPSSAGEGHLSGVAVMGESSYTRTDGRTGVVHDAMFAFDADRELAEVRRMALQFNQFCNTAQSDHAPLGFVPIAAADDHGMTLPWLDGAGVHPSMRHEEVFA